MLIELCDGTCFDLFSVIVQNSSFEIVSSQPSRKEKLEIYRQRLLRIPSEQRIQRACKRKKYQKKRNLVYGKVSTISSVTNYTAGKTICQ